MKCNIWHFQHFRGTMILVGMLWTDIFMNSKTVTCHLLKQIMYINKCTLSELSKTILKRAASFCALKAYEFIISSIAWKLRVITISNIIRETNNCPDYYITTVLITLTLAIAYLRNIRLSRLLNRNHMEKNLLICQ